MITNKKKIRALMVEIMNLNQEQRSDLLMMLSGYMSEPDYNPDFWQGVNDLISTAKK